MKRMVLVLGAVIAVAACGSSGSASPSPTASAGQLQPASIKVSLPGLKVAFSQSDIAVAEAQGYFSQEALTVTTQGLSSGVQTVQSVLSGDSDIGGSSIEPALSGAARGGLTIIGSYADRLPVVMEAQSSIARPADLKGKALGIQPNGVGAFREIMTRMIYERAGYSQSDVSYVPVPDTGYVTALLTQKIDTAILQQEQSVDAEGKNPSLHVLVDLYREMPKYFYGTYFVRPDWLQSHRDVAVRFLTAIIRAHRFIYSNRAGAIADIAQATGFPASEISKAYDRLIVQDGVFPVNQGLQADRVRFTLGKMGQLGLLPAGPPNLSTVVNRGPINSAVQSLGAWKGDPRWH
jgi:ABC-type nitrate/sulfonate/bicarbonate transport system substrate-binding protein